MTMSGSKWPWVGLGKGLFPGCQDSSPPNQKKEALIKTGTNDEFKCCLKTTVFSSKETSFFEHLKKV